MKLVSVHSEIAEHCGEIASLFKAGARVTVIVRNPGSGQNNSADLFVGDDDPAEVIKAIANLSKLAERKLTLEDLLGIPAHISDRQETP